MCHATGRGCKRAMVCIDIACATGVGGRRRGALSNQEFPMTEIHFRSSSEMDAAFRTIVDAHSAASLNAGVRA